MTLEERIEALAKHLYPGGYIFWGAEDEGTRSHWRKRSTEYIKVAFPDLFPTVHKIEP